MRGRRQRLQEEVVVAEPNTTIVHRMAPVATDLTNQTGQRRQVATGGGKAGVGTK